jgi:hypothetical protein
LAAHYTWQIADIHNGMSFDLCSIPRDLAEPVPCTGLCLGFLEAACEGDPTIGVYTDLTTLHRNSSRASIRARLAVVLRDMEREGMRGFGEGIVPGRTTDSPFSAAV